MSKENRTRKSKKNNKEEWRSDRLERKKKAFLKKRKQEIKEDFSEGEWLYG